MGFQNKQLYSFRILIVGKVYILNTTYFSAVIEGKVFTVLSFFSEMPYMCWADSVDFTDSIDLCVVLFKEL